MKRNFTACLLGGMLYAVLSGCATHETPDRLSRITGVSGDKAVTAEDQQGYLRSRFCQELLLRFGVKSYEGGSRTDALQRCLDDTASATPYPRDAFSIALSGGGARSASFSMGVLKALNHSGLLEEADAISSVSGGGYTSYWLMSQRFYGTMYAENLDGSLAEKLPATNRDYYANVLKGMAGSADVAATPFCQLVASKHQDEQNVDNLSPLFLSRTDGSILADDTYQRHIAAQSDIINYSSNGALQALESGGLVASHVVSLPFYWVTDGFLNLRLINGSVFTNAYRKGLERAYGLAPNADHDEYVDYFEHEPDQFMNAQNGSVLFWRKASQTEELHFSHLREFALAYNSCADALVDAGQVVPPLSLPIINTKLIRPYSFIDDDENYDMASLEKSVFTFSPVQWGSAHTSYQPEQQLLAPISFSKAVATSGAAVDEGARQLRGLGDFFVSAANMNLGYEMRNPATQEGPMGSAWFWTYKLLGGFPLKFVVPEDYHATLRISDGGHAENLGLYSLIERGTRRIVVVDAEHDPDYEFESLKRIRANLDANLGIELKCAEDACPLAGDYIQRQGAGVFELTATGFPWQEPSQIIYVKLSLDENRLADNLAVPSDQACLTSLADLGEGAAHYSCNVARYYDSESAQRNAFPQNITADIWYSEEQYAAYRDLAYFIGVTKLTPRLNGWKAIVQAEREQARNLVDQYRAGRPVSP